LHEAALQQVHKGFNVQHAGGTQHREIDEGGVTQEQAQHLAHHLVPISSPNIQDSIVPPVPVPPVPPSHAAILKATLGPQLVHVPAARRTSHLHVLQQQQLRRAYSDPTATSHSTPLTPTNVVEARFESTTPPVDAYTQPAHARSQGGEKDQAAGGSPAQSAYSEGSLFSKASGPSFAGGRGKQ